MSTPYKKVDKRVSIVITRNVKKPARNVLFLSGILAFIKRASSLWGAKNRSAFSYRSIFGLESVLFTILMMMGGGNQTGINDHSREGIVSTTMFDSELCYLIADGASGISSPDILYTINPNTGVVTSIGPTGTYGIESMAIDPVLGIIYACSNDTVVTVNPTTGIATAISGLGIGNVDGALGSVIIDDIDGLTYDTTANILWASERRTTGNDIIFQINPSTGDFISDAFGLGIDYLEIVTTEEDLDDIAIGPDGTLYVISNDDGTGNQHMGVVNKLTGAYTEIGDYGIQGVEGLGFSQSGQLFGTTGNNGSNANVFFTIDPGTSEFAYLHSIAPANDVEACDCRHVALQQ